MGPGHEEESGGAARCFVCLEEEEEGGGEDKAEGGDVAEEEGAAGEAAAGALVAACRCSRVHVRCFQQLVERVPAHATQCAVCLAPYRLVETWRTEWRCHALCCVAFGAMGVVVGAGAATLVYAHAAPYASGGGRAVADVCLGTAVALWCFALTWALLQFYERTGRACCVWRAHVRTGVRVLPLVDPAR